MDEDSGVRQATIVIDPDRLREIIREELRDELRRKYAERIEELEDCLQWLLDHGWSSARVMRVLKRHL